METITTASLYKNASEQTKSLVSELQKQKDKTTSSITGLGLRRRFFSQQSTDQNSPAGGPGR